MNPIFKKSKVGMILFTAPVVILFLVLMVYPLGQALIMSFTEWDGLNDATFIGFENYEKLFTTRTFSTAMKNSIIYSLFLTTYQICLATVFSFVLVNSKIRGKTFFKDVYFFPVLLSVSVVAQLWVAIYHGQYGLINQIAESLGLSWSQDWLSSANQGIFAIVLAESWKGMGYHMLIIYAAMRNVPSTYYEASYIDGASPTKQFFKITLPLIVPTVKMCVIMCITYGFRAFEMIYIMTGGGPGDASTTLPIMMYEAMFSLKQAGYANAISVVMVIICIIIMQVIDRTTRRLEVEM